MSDPRQKFISAAHSLFSDKGFHGTSLNDVAAELGLTKQSVIYHFKTKQALYGAVLEQMAARFDGAYAGILAPDLPPQDRFSRFAETLHDYMQGNPTDARLIARELIDNPDRAAGSRKWYLKPFLDTSVALMRDLPDYKGADEATLSAAAYQVIGAINYFAISDATLTGVWGADHLRGMKVVFLQTLLTQSRND